MGWLASANESANSWALDNRELATLIWLAIFAIFCIAHPKIRPSVVDTAKSTRHPVIWLSLLLLGAYVAGEAWLGSNLGLWSWNLAKETVVWFMTGAIALWFTADRAAKQPGYFGNAVFDTLKFTAIAEFFVGLHAFSLVVELVLQPVIAILAMASVYASFHPEYASGKRLCDSLLGITALSILAFEANFLIHHSSELNPLDVLLSFLLPVWMTLLLLPFLLVFCLIVSYNSCFVFLNHTEGISHGTRFAVKLGVISVLHGRLRTAEKFTRQWRFQVANARSFAAARTLAKRYLSELEEEHRVAVATAENLVTFAGADSVDAEGRRLDRREFHETRKALDWLAACMPGHYQRANRYRQDILDVLDDDFTRHGLQKPSGIHVAVSGDGQRWYAWRRTISGWVLAIGSAGPHPYNEWKFDGPEPPASFPGEDVAWGASQFDESAHPNWTDTPV